MGLGARFAGSYAEPVDQFDLWSEDDGTSKSGPSSYVVPDDEDSEVDADYARGYPRDSPDAHGGLRGLQQKSFGCSGKYQGAVPVSRIFLRILNLTIRRRSLLSLPTLVTERITVTATQYL